MKRTKLLSIILAGIFCTSLIFGGCAKKEGTPKKDTTTSTAQRDITAANDDTSELIKLKVMGAKHTLHGEWEEMDFWITLSERNNIEFEFETVPVENIREKLSITLAGRDYPDVFFGMGESIRSDEVKYGAQGVFLALEDYIEQYAPNLVEALAAVEGARGSITTPDGHIYSLPYINAKNPAAQPSLWVNGYWLENVGLEELPDTIEGFRSVLEKFRNEDANKNGEEDEIPLSISNGGVPPSILSAFGLLSRMFFVENDKVILAAIDERYRDYLEFVHGLYKDKLLDPDGFSQTMQQMIAKGKDGKVGMAHVSVPSLIFDADLPIHRLYPVMVSSYNPEKMLPEFQGIIRGAVVLSSSNKYPERTIAMFDWCYTNEGSVFTMFGDEDSGYWEWTDETKTARKAITPPEGVSTEQLRGRVTPAVGVTVPLWQRIENAKGYIQELTPEGFNFRKHRFTICEEILVPYLKLAYPILYNTQEEQDIILELQPDLQSYIDNMHAKFITGAEPLSNWDSYVEAIKKMQIDRLLEVYQQAYDRWLSAQ